MSVENSGSRCPTLRYSPFDIQSLRDISIRMIAAISTDMQSLRDNLSRSGDITELALK